MFTIKELFERRRQRTRSKLRKGKSGHPRLSVHRSSKHIYAQVIDDILGTTLAAASLLDVVFNSEFSKTADFAVSCLVVKLVAVLAFS